MVDNLAPLDMPFVSIIANIISLASPKITLALVYYLLFAKWNFYTLRKYAKVE